MNSSKILRLIYTYFSQRWITSVFIATVPGFFFLFTQIAGKTLGLVTSDGTLATGFDFIFYFLFIISFIFAFLKSAGDTYNIKVESRAGELRRELLESANKIALLKMRKYRDFITSNPQRNNPLHDTTNQIDHITVILEEMRSLIAKTAHISLDDIGVSLIIKESKDTSWKCFYKVNTENDLRINQVVNNHNSTAYQVINKNTATMFYADKKQGIEEENYIPCPRDEPSGNIGSIICRDISVGDDNINIGAVLCISTYNQYLCSRKDNDARIKFTERILPTFEHRIRLELAAYFINITQPYVANTASPADS